MPIYRLTRTESKIRGLATTPGQVKVLVDVDRKLIVVKKWCMWQPFYRRVMQEYNKSRRATTNPHDWPLHPLEKSIVGLELGTRWRIKFPYLVDFTFIQSDVEIRNTLMSIITRKKARLFLIGKEPL
jgi:hypothetical protein